MEEKEQVRSWLAYRKKRPYHLCRESGVSTASLYLWLNGKRSITMATWAKLKAAMK